MSYTICYDSCFCVELARLNFPFLSASVDIIASHSDHNIIIGIDTRGNDVLLHISNVLRIKEGDVLSLLDQRLEENADEVELIGACYIKSVFTIVMKSSGKLDSHPVLFDESKITIWSTNVNSTDSSTVHAVLQDNGNLVLKNENHSPKILWESFDHPAHTWLPGSKLGYNNRTKSNQRLISWKNSEDPAPGLYSLELDTSGTNSYKILWNGSKSYWTSGAWNGKIFEMVPEMGFNLFFNFQYVTNANESYFVYYVKDNFTMSRFIMDVSGQIKQLSWLPKDSWNSFWSQPPQQCGVPNFCGAFGICNDKSLPFCNCLMGFEPKSQHFWDLKDYSGGCRRKTNVNCENESLLTNENDDRKQRFVELRNIIYKDPKLYVQLGSSAGCESMCLKNCSCTAYALNGSGCLIWIGDLLNLIELSQDETTGKTLYVRLAASEFGSSRNDEKNRGIYIEPSADGKVAFFPSWAASVTIDGGDVQSLLDPSLEGNADLEELTRVCRVACWCIQDDETRRPSMGQIVQILEGIIDVKVPPFPRSLRVFVDNQETLVFFGESSSSQS
ncbi:hypothetical protein FEM48_Zijuj04G0079300 [Ziziphus jujuba var. spinosa]|uniref:Apple domain-containing protein n=1 Tax=Ziziphus jujuba var. spinosa TaxID=714518 RepID=A0A978VIP6_ZIZJJ|nr:hypothetical protein FEM48_Zijuj04G0079300 [Ziziphus jujuba var. spinosa]